MPDSELSLLRTVDIRVASELSFEQLATLRHRGAFSTVSSTFATCCIRCGQIEDEDLQQLPMLWYQVSWSQRLILLSLTTQ